MYDVCNVLQVTSNPFSFICCRAILSNNVRCKSLRATINIHFALGLTEQNKASNEPHNNDRYSHHLCACHYVYELYLCVRVCVIIIKYMYC